MRPAAGGAAAAAARACRHVGRTQAFHHADRRRHVFAARLAGCAGAVSRRRMHQRRQELVHRHGAHNCCNLVLVLPHWRQRVLLQQVLVKLPHLALHLDRQLLKDLLVASQLLKEHGRHHLQRVHDCQRHLPQLVDAQVVEACVEQPLQLGLILVRADQSKQRLLGGREHRAVRVCACVGRTCMHKQGLVVGA
eukprot:364235-Chlamydomonas_euryale.AAC.6